MFIGLQVVQAFTYCVCISVVCMSVCMCVHACVSVCARACTVCVHVYVHGCGCMCYARYGLVYKYESLNLLITRDNPLVGPCIYCIT